MKKMRLVWVLLLVLCVVEARKVCGVCDIACSSLSCTTCLGCEDKKGKLKMDAKYTGNLEGLKKKLCIVPPVNHFGSVNIEICTDVVGELGIDHIYFKVQPNEAGKQEIRKRAKVGFNQLHRVTTLDSTSTFQVYLSSASALPNFYSFF